MNSFNHFNNGSVLQWMYEEMLGIKLDSGQENQNKETIQLKPGIILDYDKAPLHRAEGSYKSVYGEIKAVWNIEKTQITYEVTIPANCGAQLFLPVYDGGSRQETEAEFSGRQITQTSELSAGNYVFVYNRQNNAWERR